MLSFLALEIGNFPGSISHLHNRSLYADRFFTPKSHSRSPFIKHTPAAAAGVWNSCYIARKAANKIFLGAFCDEGEPILPPHAGDQMISAGMTKEKGRNLGQNKEKKPP
jgi:hypothetical protein